MTNRFQRTELLLGSNSMEKLKESKVLVFGIGGVGTYTIEALARSGIGTIDIVDYDRVDITNINRQLIALESTLGMKKVDVMKSRLLDINPDINVETIELKYGKDSSNMFDFLKYDYVVDAIDTISAKIDIIDNCKKLGVNIISSMGTGNKIDPLKIEIGDIYNTQYCPLARIMRRELRKRNVESLKVLWSREIPEKVIVGDTTFKRSPASVSFVPSVAGLVIASEVIKDIIGK